MTRIVVRSLGAGLVACVATRLALAALGAVNDVAVLWLCLGAAIGAFLFTFARQPFPCDCGDDWSPDLDVRGKDAVAAARTIAEWDGSR